MENNIFINNYDGEYFLVIVLDNLPFPTEKSIKIDCNKNTPPTDLQIKTALINLINKINILEIPINNIKY